MKGSRYFSLYMPVGQSFIVGWPSGVRISYMHARHFSQMILGYSPYVIQRPIQVVVNT